MTIKNVHKIGEGGFATVYQGKWKNGPRFVSNNKRYYCENGYITLKKLKNISDESLEEVNNLI